MKYYAAMGKTIAVRQAPDAGGASPGTLSYLLSDQLGSTTGLMDTAGAVTGTIVTSAYG